MDDAERIQSLEHDLRAALQKAKEANDARTSALDDVEKSQLEKQAAEDKAEALVRELQAEKQNSQTIKADFNRSEIALVAETKAVAELRKQLAREKTARTELEAKLQTHGTDKSRRQREYDQLRSDLNSISRDLDIKKDDIETLQKSLEDAEAQIWDARKLEQEAVYQKEENARELQKANEALERAMSKVNLLVHALRKGHSSIRLEQTLRDELDKVFVMRPGEEMVLDRDLADLLERAEQARQAAEQAGSAGNSSSGDSNAGSDDEDETTAGLQPPSVSSTTSATQTEPESPAIPERVPLQHVRYVSVETEPDAPESPVQPAPLRTQIINQASIEPDAPESPAPLPRHGFRMGGQISTEPDAPESPAPPTPLEVRHYASIQTQPDPPSPVQPSPIHIDQGIQTDAPESPAPFQTQIINQASIEPDAPALPAPPAPLGFRVGGQIFTEPEAPESPVEPAPIQLDQGVQTEPDAPEAPALPAPFQIQIGNRIQAEPDVPEEPEAPAPPAPFEIQIVNQVQAEPDPPEAPAPPAPEPQNDLRNRHPGRAPRATTQQRGTQTRESRTLNQPIPERITTFRDAFWRKHYIKLLVCALLFFIAAAMYACYDYHKHKELWMAANDYTRKMVVNERHWRSGAGHGGAVGHHGDKEQVWAYYVYKPSPWSPTKLLEGLDETLKGLWGKAQGATGAARASPSAG